MASSRLICGCRRRSVRKHGHRPACAFYDVERDNGHRKRLSLRRKYEADGASYDHARGVILWV